MRRGGCFGPREIVNSSCLVCQSLKKIKLLYVNIQLYSLKAHGHSLFNPIEGSLSSFGVCGVNCLDVPPRDSFLARDPPLITYLKHSPTPS